MEELSAFGQLVRSILPQARRIAIFGCDGQLRWASGSPKDSALRLLVTALLAQSKAGQSAATSVEDATAAYAFRICDGTGALHGVLAFSCETAPDGAVTDATAVIGRKIAPLLAILARDLTRDRTRETLQQHIDETMQLAWLRDSPAVDIESDPIEHLCERLVAKLDADLLVASDPGHHFERCYTRPDCRLQDIDALRTEAIGKILRLAQSRGESLCVNRSRLNANSDVFRFVTVPLSQRGATVGALTVFSAHSRRRLQRRDARLLERVAPRLRELIELRVDAATGLPTRAAMEQFVASSKDGQASSRCVVYLDVDQMHVLNDLFGFDTGDEVLRRLAALWPAGRIDRDGLMGRLSGDRFVVILNDCTLNRARAWADTARTMIEQLAIPEVCSGFKLSASLGVAVLEAGERFETALACAATACRAAKDRGRNQVALFTENDRSLLQRQDDLHLFRQIIGALEGQRLQLMAQPIIPLRDTARGTQYELLVRLIDSSGNALGPAKFLSAATRYQLLPKLDRGVLRRALAEIAPFAHVLAEQRAICWINVAGPSVGQPDFADFVRTSIKSSTVPGCLIGFEFTEGAAIGNLDAARRFIERVRELGCSFALDDFGTGFSSLAYLKTLAVSAVKIDGAFIRDLLTDARSDALVAAVLEIARQLGLDTVAEFIESPETAERLRALGVTFGQGYHFARPRLLLDVLTELAAARSSPILQLASG